MSSKTQHPGSVPGLAPETRAAATPERPLAAPTTRADGTLDWSIAMARAQQGDRHAYRCLLEEITPYLRALAVRHVGNRSDIEDTVQDILLTIHAVRNTYDPSRPFGPWLVAIARRRIIDGLRRRGRVGAHETALGPEHETFSASETNLQEQAADARMLREALARLSSGQREAIRMLKLEDMSLTEASTASGMSVAALKVATHRALKSLRKLIEKRGNST